MALEDKDLEDSDIEEDMEDNEIEEDIEDSDIEEDMEDTDIEEDFEDSDIEEDTDMEDSDSEEDEDTDDSEIKNDADIDRLIMRDTQRVRDMEEEMKMANKNPEINKADEQFDLRDRLSDLPEFILHHIFSFFNSPMSSFKFARVSKKFYRLWSTNPVLKFDTNLNWSTKLLKFVHNTMLRYFDYKLVIKEFRVKMELHDFYGGYMGIGCMIDDWVRIAAMNHVENIEICIVSSYTTRDENIVHRKLFRLPRFVLSTKSLKVLKLDGLEFDDLRYRGIDKESVNLGSLECLQLKNVEFKDECLFRHLITSCPLKVLKIENCPGLVSQLDFSKCSKIREVLIRQEGFLMFDLINLEGSTVEDFSHYGMVKTDNQWPFIIGDPGKLLNLRKLTVASAPITDEMVESLVPRLPSLEDLMLDECNALEHVMISSSSIRSFGLKKCSKLEKLEIDAPSLYSFCIFLNFSGKYPTLSLRKRPPHCKAFVLQEVEYPIKTCYFTRLREFLVQSNMFSFLSLSLAFGEKVEFNVEDVVETHLGTPYKLNQLELKLHYTEPVESAISSLIEGLFWSCRPNVISLSMKMAYHSSFYTNSGYFSHQPNVHKMVVKELMQKLNSCAVSWRYALDGVEVDSIDWNWLYKKSDRYVDLGFNLYW